MMRKYLLLGFYILSSLVTATIFSLYPGVDSNRAAGFIELLNRSANRPYVYRVLLPVTVKIISKAIPQCARRDIVSMADSRPNIRRLLEAFRWNHSYTFEYIVLYVIFVLCFVGFAYSLRRLIMIFYDFPRFVADLAPVGALLALPLYFRYCSYIYDPAVIFLFTLGILFTATRNRTLYYLTFVLASLNKETTVLLIGLFILREWNAIGKSRLMVHVLVQALIWILIKAGLAIAYAGNPGSLISFHLLDHNLVLYRFPTALLYFIAVVIVHLILIARGWNEKPIFLRRGLLLTLIPLMALAFVSGFVDELRDYYEAVPFIVLLALPTVVRIFGLTRDSYGVQTADTAELSGTNA